MHSGISKIKISKKKHVLVFNGMYLNEVLLCGCWLKSFPFASTQVGSRYVILSSFQNLERVHKKNPILSDPSLSPLFSLSVGRGPKLMGSPFVFNRLIHLILGRKTIQPLLRISNKRQIISNNVYISGKYTPFLYHRQNHFNQRLFKEGNKKCFPSNGKHVFCGISLKDYAFPLKNK